MTPLLQRWVLRKHFETVMSDAALEIFHAAGITTDDEKTTTLREAAARLSDDHPAMLWFNTVGLGLAYRDAIAEREGWPSQEDDERIIDQQMLSDMRHAGTA